MTARHGSPQARSRAPQATQARRQAALLRLSTGIAAAHAEIDVCRAVVEGLHDEALGYDFLGLFLVDPPSGDRLLQASVGWPEVPTHFRVPPGSGLSEQAVLDVIRQDLQELRGEAQRAHRVTHTSSASTVAKLYSR